MGKLGKMIKSPFERFSPKALITYLMYLPLNLIPVIGTVMFVLLQGKRGGPRAHARYFQLKSWSNSKRTEFIEENRGAYTRYVAMNHIKLASLLTDIQFRCDADSA
jgi:hypothetical protein